MVSNAGAKLEFTQCRVGSDDAFFLASQSQQPLSAKCRFRTQGTVAELWRPDSGQVEVLPIVPQPAHLISSAISPAVRFMRTRCGSKRFQQADV